MPKPRRFLSRQQLVQCMAAYPWAGSFAGARLAARASTLDEIVRTAVGRNTFRAFHHMSNPPSHVFRTWASAALTENCLNDLQRLDSQSAYTAWLYELANGFRTYWRHQMGHEIGFGPSLKLPNLLAKRLAVYRNISQRSFDRFVWWLEIPLDSYSIQAVATLATSFPDAGAIGNIPSSATMNFVKDIRAYEAFQQGIREIAKAAGVPPITLDLLAWDEAHERKSVAATAS